MTDCQSYTNMKSITFVANCFSSNRKVIHSWHICNYQSQMQFYAEIGVNESGWLIYKLRGLDQYSLNPLDFWNKTLKFRHHKLSLFHCLFPTPWAWGVSTADGNEVSAIFAGQDSQKVLDWAQDFSQAQLSNNPSTWYVFDGTISKVKHTPHIYIKWILYFYLFLKNQH